MWEVQIGEGPVFFFQRVDGTAWRGGKGRREGGRTSVASVF